MFSVNKSQLKSKLSWLWPLIILCACKVEKKSSNDDSPISMAQDSTLDLVPEQGVTTCMTVLPCGGAFAFAPWGLLSYNSARIVTDRDGLAPGWTLEEVFMDGANNTLVFESRERMPQTYKLLDGVFLNVDPTKRNEKLVKLNADTLHRLVVGGEEYYYKKFNNYYRVVQKTGKYAYENVTFNRTSSGQLTKINMFGHRFLQIDRDTNEKIIAFTSGVNSLPEETFKLEYSAGLLSGIKHFYGSVEIVQDGMSFQYELGKVKNVDAAEGATLSITYNSNGAVTSIRNEVQAETTFQYADANGSTPAIYIINYDQPKPVSRGGYRFEFSSIRDLNGYPLVTRSQNGMNNTTYAYSSTGQLTSVTDFMGIVERYEYYDGSPDVPNSDAGRLRRVISPDGTFTTFYYNTASNTNPISFSTDLLTSVTQTLGETATGTKKQFTYDAWTRPIGIQAYEGISFNSEIFTFSINENSTSRVREEILSQAGKTVSRETSTLDANGLLVSQTDKLGLTTTYTYDNDGDVTRKAAPFETTTFTYDSSKRPTNVTSTTGNVIVSQDITYDAQGNIASAQSNKNLAGSREYQSKSYKGKHRDSETQGRESIANAKTVAHHFTETVYDPVTATSTFREYTTRLRNPLNGLSAEILNTRESFAPKPLTQTFPAIPTPKP